MMVEGDVVLELAAIDNASLTRVASQRRSIDQPTILREKGASTAQQ